MTRPDGLSPAALALERVTPRLVDAALRWRCGERSTLGLTEARADLLAADLRALEGVARGQEEAPTEATRVHARRTWALLESAPDLDDLAQRWDAARAELPQGPADPEEVHQRALRTPTPALAAELWHAARAPLLELRHRVDGVGEPLHAALRAPGDAAAASAFLAASRDVWLDARAHAVRHAGDVKGLPDPLVHARLLAAPELAGLLTVAACRHVARALAQRLLGGEARLKRVSVRPRPWLGAFPVLLPDGLPRVGWAEHAGVPSLLDLVQATSTACALSLMGPAADPLAAAAVARLHTLGVLGAPVLRRELSLFKGDAERLARHAGTVLLRQARVAAALSVLDPAGPSAARDGLADATGSDPDLLEAAGLVTPWPVPVPGLGPLGVEHGPRWDAWRLAGTLALAARDAWDEDFVLRDVTGEALHAALAEPVPERPAAQALREALGAGQDQPAALVRFFEEHLG